MFVTDNLCLSHTCILGQITCVFNFMGPQIEKNCSQEFYLIGYSPTLDLDERFWTFEQMRFR